MANTNGNGTLTKLTGMRQRFMVDFQGMAAQFRINVQGLREKYLNEIIDLTMSDEKVADVLRALEFFRPSNVVTVIPPEGPATIVAPPTEVPPDVAPTVLPPEKQVMKASRRGRRPAYGSCPNCNTPIWEAGAKFCSRCAYPLDEV